MLHNYYKLGTTNKLSMLFQALGLWLQLNEIFFLGLGLTVTEINIKKVQKHKKCSTSSVEEDGYKKYFGRVAGDRVYCTWLLTELKQKVAETL